MYSFAASVAAQGHLFQKFGPGVAVILGVVIVVCRATELVAVDFPDGEPMENVLAAIKRAEREHDVVWDLLDPNLWQSLNGGTRIYGMPRESIHGRGA